MSDTDDTFDTDDGSDEGSNLLIKRARRAFVHKTTKSHSMSSNPPRSASTRNLRPAGDRFDVFCLAASA